MSIQACPDPLERRLEKATRAWLETAIPSPSDPAGTLEAARQRLAKLNIRLRDEDTVITPEQDKAKSPRLILTCSDEGRYKPYTPIRRFRLELTFWSNSKLPPTESEALAGLCNCLELLLDSTNLQTALSSAAFQVQAMLANRQPGKGHGVKGDIRLDTYAIQGCAVGLEHTV